MAAAFVGNICALRVAAEAEIVLLLAGGRFQQLVLVRRSVRVVAGQAIANGRLVDLSLDLRGIFVAVAGEAELVRGGGDQHYPGGVFVDADLVTAQTAGGDSGVDGLALGFVFVTLEAFRAIDLGIKRNGVNSTEGTRETNGSQAQGQHDAQNQAFAPGGVISGKPKVLALAHELGKAAHPNLLIAMVHEGRRPDGCCENFHRFLK